MEVFLQDLDNSLTSILFVVAGFALLIHIFFLIGAAWRTWRGENSFDRLIGLDLTGVLIFCILVIFAVMSEFHPALQGNFDNAIFVDVGLGLVAVSYLATIALAKYIIDHRTF
jgi:multisubunit Na+/H+ antiporter MnhF subunit